MQILGTKTGLKILKILVENPFQEFKEIELVHKAGTGKGSASSVVDLLVESNVVNEKKIGKSKIISLNLHNRLAFLFKVMIDQEKLSRMEEKRLAALMLFLNNVKTISRLVAVFGSSFAGTQTDESDIDVLIETGKLERVQVERKKIEELFGLRFNLHFYKEGDEFSKNALLNGAIIHGLDFGREIFSSMEKRRDFERIFYFNERVKSALRNYNRKDYQAAESIMKTLIEQLVIYILMENNIKFESKKHAMDLVKKTKEGKKIKKMIDSPLKLRFGLMEGLIINLLTKKILKNEGY
jgi:predicted nucleotidyltransferase